MIPPTLADPFSTQSLTCNPPPGVPSHSSRRSCGTPTNGQRCSKRYHIDTVGPPRPVLSIPPSTPQPHCPRLPSFRRQVPSLSSLRQSTAMAGRTGARLPRRTTTRSMLVPSVMYASLSLSLLPPLERSALPSSSVCLDFRPPRLDCGRADKCDAQGWLADGLLLLQVRVLRPRFWGALLIPNPDLNSPFPPLQHRMGQPSSAVGYARVSHPLSRHAPPPRQSPILTSAPVPPRSGPTPYGVDKAAAYAEQVFLTELKDLVNTYKPDLVNGDYCTLLNSTELR